MPHLTRIPKSRAFWLPLLLAGALSSAAHAQIGGTTDILTGLVVGPDNQPMRLTDIEIRAFLTPVRIPDRPTPGSVERSLSATQISNLPIDADDLNLLATRRAVGAAPRRNQVRGRCGSFAGTEQTS